MNKVLLRGYYGFGNLGDDILMKTSFEILKEKFPNTKIDVFSLSQNPKYLLEILGENVSIVNNEDEGYKYVVHGGGGVHFDFKKGSLKDFLINTGIKLIGNKLFSVLYFALKRNKIKHKRIGLGLGVGTFTYSSKKMVSNALLFSEYKVVMYRDKESNTNLKRLRYKGERVYGGDLAFLRSHWLPKLTTKSDAKKIGIVVRYWEHGSESNENILKSWCKALSSQENEVVFFLFEEEGDQKLKNILQENALSFHVWEPQKMALLDYLNLLNECGVIISSRAHGAIVGNVLKKPVVCLEIEPKLKNVHKMIPDSSLLLPYQISSAELVEAVEKLQANYSQYSQKAEQEAEMNKSKVTEAVNYVFQRFC